MLTMSSAPLALFRESPAGALAPDAMAILHITDVHADPFYDVSQYLCGNKGSTRNLTLQDAKGKPTKDLCSAGGAPVKGQCGPWAGSHEHMRDYWEHTIRPGKQCPCGVAFSNPPFSIMPPLVAAMEEFANDGYAAQAAIYTGDLAGHYMPGTSVQLEADGCKTAQAVVKSTIDLLNVPNVEHFFVLGNNDVIPKNTPLKAEWLEDLGAFLLDRDWLTEPELASRIHTTGLCAIGLNSNHWTPTQVNHKMRRAQLAWLPGVLGRKGETSACTSGFLVVSHIGVVCPGAPVHGGNVENDNLWDETKSSALHCGEVRAILDRHEDAVVAEMSGDLNKEYIYASGQESFGFTATGVSPRGGNDPGFHRVFLSGDGARVTEVESYQMKRGCDFEWGHSMVESYAPHLDAGIDAAAVAGLLQDPATKKARKANVAPNAAGITKAQVFGKTGEAEAFRALVRRGEAGCLAPDAVEVPPAALVERAEAEGEDVMANPDYDGDGDDGEVQAVSSQGEHKGFFHLLWDGFFSMLAAVSEGKEVMLPQGLAQGGGEGVAPTEPRSGAWGMVGVAGLGLAVLAVGAAARRRGSAQLLPQGPEEEEEYPEAEYVRVVE